jgi:uncharacterized Zn-binding protein involved in type VI secretion
VSEVYGTFPIIDGESNFLATGKQLPGMGTTLAVVQCSSHGKKEYLINVTMEFAMVWTIEGKGEVVRLGDSTTHGGKVITGSPNASYMGIPIARVGDQVSCPKCEGVHTIITGAPHAFDHGDAIACHGDLVSCGAKLIARNADGNHQEDYLSSTVIQEKYDEQVAAIDQATNNQIAFYPYFIQTASGKTYAGRTDYNGNTPRIYTLKEEEYELFWGEEAIEKGSS